MIYMPMLPWQAEFCDDIETPELALVGGLGSGKTIAFCRKAIIMAMVNCDGPNYETRGGLFEPTQDLMRTHLLPNMEAQLKLAGIDYEWHSSQAVLDLKFKAGNFPYKLTSAENYQRIIAYNWAVAGFEELDTSDFEIAKSGYAKGKERVRWGKYRQTFSTSTIEGIKFLHHNFVDNASDRKRTIHANSELNPLLPKDWIEDLKRDMSPQEYKVRVQGEWGNILSDIVYDYYKDEMAPYGNITDKLLSDFPRDILHIGMDFNTGHCSSVVHIMRDNMALALDEITADKNFKTILEIRTRYPGREIWCYPDTSGDNENYIGWDTAIGELREAGFKVLLNSRAKTPKTSDDIKKGSNPFVGDRIKAMNNLMLNTHGQRRYLVNKRQCPKLHKSLISQMWIKKGDSKVPDKSNDVDHPLDATGYFVFKNWPPRKNGPTVRIS